MSRTFTPTLRQNERGRRWGTSVCSVFDPVDGGGVRRVRRYRAAHGGVRRARVRRHSHQHRPCRGTGEDRLRSGPRRDGPPLAAESATVRTYYLPPDSEAREARETLTASYEAWPFLGGVFVSSHQPGHRWRLGTGDGIHQQRGAGRNGQVSVLGQGDQRHTGHRRRGSRKRDRQGIGRARPFAHHHRPRSLIRACTPCRSMRRWPRPSPSWSCSPLRPIA